MTTPRNVCKVEQCDRPSKTKGWCQAHYMRWWSTGKEPTGAVGSGGLSGAAVAADPIVRFFGLVDKNGPGCCWQWKGRLGDTGYGRFKIKQGQQVAPHRWSYEHHIGPIPDGLEVDHLCRNRACVNPEHLEAVTRLENVRRSVPFRVSPTHCPKGHEYTMENRLMNTRGNGFGCKECNRISSRNYQRRKAAERRATA